MRLALVSTAGISIIALGAGDGQAQMTASGPPPTVAAGNVKAMPQPKAKEVSKVSPDLDPAKKGPDSPVLGLLWLLMGSPKNR